MALMFPVNTQTLKENYTHTDTYIQLEDYTRNYWVFGLCSLSGILKTREHNVSETGSVSVLRRGGKTHTHLRPLERANFNHWTT
jgi:hypothetical protein